MGRNWVGPPPSRATDFATKGYVDNETGEPTPENFASTFTAAAPTSQQSAGIASESQAGITQIATAAETNAGVVTSKSVSPKNLVARGTGIIFVQDITALLALTGMPDFQWAFVSTTHALVFYNGTTSKWFLADTSGHLAFPTIADRDAFTSNIQGMFVGLRCTITTDSSLGTTGSVYRWNGSAWQAWETAFMNYSPTITGISGTQGGSPGWIVNFARYRYVAGHVEGDVMVTLNGSTAALTATMVLTTPTTMSTTYASFPGVPVLKGVAQITDNSPTTTYDGLPNRTGANNNQMKFVILGTNGLVQNVLATMPMTWAQNDSVVCHYSYEVD